MHQFMWQFYTYMDRRRNTHTPNWLHHSHYQGMWQGWLLHFPPHWGRADSAWHLCTGGWAHGPPHARCSWQVCEPFLPKHHKSIQPGECTPTMFITFWTILCLLWVFLMISCKAHCCVHSKNQTWVEHMRTRVTSHASILSMDQDDRMSAM